MKRPVILVTNDDGVHADGIRALAESLAPLGRVVIVAPETEQSAMSHAMTLSRPLRLRHVGPDRHAVDGTPADCVYVALLHRGLLPAPPSLVVSGINHGVNLGSDVFYSGTVAGAREGAMRGIPALAVSLASHGRLEVAARIARDVAAKLLGAARRGFEGVPLLNVNVPAGRLRGLRATRLGPRLYEDLVDLRTDPRGRHYLWIGGPSVRQPHVPGTDTAAHDDGFATVSALGVDLWNAHHGDAIESLLRDLKSTARPASGRRANGATTSARRATRNPSKRTS